MGITKIKQNNFQTKLTIKFTGAFLFSRLPQ